MRVLITGGLGFIGGRIGVHLSEIGHEVLFGTRSARTRIDWLPDGKILQMNWMEGRKLAKACEGVNLIIHCAGMSSRECEINPENAIKVREEACTNLISNALQNNVEAFVYLSSAHVYRNPLEGRLDESSPTSNSHPYALSHLAAEAIVREASLKDNLNTLTLRLSNIYGAPCSKESTSWNLFVNNLCKQATTDRKLTVHATPSENRDFIPMTDVVNFIVKYMEDEDKNNFPQVLNIGSGKSRTLHEMAVFIQKRCEIVLGYSPDIKFNHEMSDQLINKLEFESLYPDLFQSEIENSANMELDKLLKFAAENFGV